VTARLESAIFGVRDRHDRRPARDLANATKRRRAAAFKEINVDEDGVGRVCHDVVTVDIVGRRNHLDPTGAQDGRKVRHEQFLRLD
jgi:hypothetical protein